MMVAIIAISTFKVLKKSNSNELFRLENSILLCM